LRIQRLREGFFLVDKGISPKEYFFNLKKVCMDELLNPFIVPNSRGRLLCLQKNTFWWDTALLTEALETSYSNFGKQTDLDALIKFYDKKISSNGQFYNINLLEDVGNIMHGEILIFLHQKTNDNRYLVAINNIYEFTKAYSRSSSGILSYSKDNPQRILVDTLGMICPFLMRYGKIFGDQEATTLAESQLLDFINHGVERNTGLPYHGYIAGKNGNIGISGWSRGTGWYLKGLVGVLQYLPEDSSLRPTLFSALENLAKTLESCQSIDGAWTCNISDPYTEGETSATAMIACYLEKAIALNFLPKTYYGMLDRAYSFLVKNTTEKGFVKGATGDGQYSLELRHYPWAQGPATAFLCLYLKRTKSN
jgi:rhamnogalacturonyl hydrolase YesR